MPGQVRPEYCDKCPKTCDYDWTATEADDRTYVKTHPWIKFSVDLRAASAQLWMLLGEARSKVDHIAGVPLKPAIEADLLKVQLARGVHATTAIEGNSLSVQDVEKQIDGKLEVPRSKEYLAQEVKNVLEAIKGLLHPEILAGDLPPICPKRVKELNAIVLKNLELEGGAIPGEIRKHEVGVGRYRGAPARECEHLLYRLCGWLNGSDFDLPDGNEWRIPIALVRAIVAHLYIEWIHPFGDGNGRTGRLVEYHLLAMSGIPEVACHLLSNHYNDTRAEYYRQLERASASGGEVLPFIEYAVRGFVDGLAEHVETVRQQQWDISWVNYVHEQVQRKNTRSRERMRELVFALSWAREVVSRRDILGLTAQMTLAYTNREKSLSRDLNALEAMGLIVKTPEGYRACREKILAFLPARHERRKKDELPVVESTPTGVAVETLSPG